MAVSDIQTSLNGGELSPNLYARVDLAKYESGAALLRNFIVNYQGGASYRPGTEFIVATKNPTDPPPRLLPFIVSTEASYILEFGAGYIRFIQNGVQLESSPGVAYEVSTPYVQDDLATVKYTQSADVMTLTHPSYPPANLTRTSDTTFAYAALTVGPVITPPSFSDIAATNGGSYFYGYVVTAVDLDGKEESLPSAPGTDVSVILDETANDVIKIMLTASADPTSVYNVYKWGPVDVDGLPGTVWGLIGSTKTTIFTDNNIAPDYSKEPPGWGDPFSGGQFESINVATGGSGYTASGWSDTPYVGLTITGDGTGAAGFAVFTNDSGEVVGVYLTNTGKDYTTATVSATGMGGSGATFTFTFTDPDPLYPACAAYYQQRRVLGGSNLKPETLVMSETSRYDNFNTTPVALDTDAIVMSLASLEVNTIKSLVPVNYGLLAFTTGNVFLINGGQPYAAITPSSITAQVQVSNGCNDIQPLRVNYDVLYIQNKGNRVRDLNFVWQKQAYTGSDISALAAHLFDGFEAVDWTYSEEPFKTVWEVRDDGRMLACTYVPDQEVYAWTRHDTQGAFKSVASIPEDALNRVYIIAQRHVDSGEGTPCWVNYIERMMPTDCCIFDAWYLDSALTLNHTVLESDIFITGDTETVGAVVTVTSYDPCDDPAPTDGPFITGTASYTIYNTPGADTYTVPAGVTSIIVECIGSGSGGSAAFAKGGGGGGWAQKTLAVTPGAVWNVFVGAGGLGTIDITQNSGQDSWFSSGGSGSAVCLAIGGFGNEGGGHVGSPGVGDFTTKGGTSAWNGALNGNNGGGGAGGPNGDGAGGGEGLFGGGGGGGGGGGSGGGSHGQDGSGAVGGAGGNNFLGTGGGALGQPGVEGGGGGGWTFSAPGTARQGGDGIDMAAGACGAGGGGGAVRNSPAGGGDGGQAGGGAGAGQGSFGGTGGNGLVLVTVPESPTDVVNVSDIIQIGCGKIRIIEVVSAVQVTGVITVPLGLTVPDDPDGLSFPVMEGGWTVVTPVDTVTGLDHLEGKSVSALADGLVVHGLTVVEGSVTLPFEASNIVVGLDYTGQIKTLYLNVEGLKAGSIQGDRKFLPGATLRVDCTRGLAMGPDFDHMVVPPELIQQGTSVALYTGDAYAPIYPDWNTRGEICVRQSDPLPATVLGIIVKVVSGDTGR